MNTLNPDKICDKYIGRSIEQFIFGNVWISITGTSFDITPHIGYMREAAERPGFNYITVESFQRFSPKTNLCKQKSVRSYYSDIHDSRVCKIDCDLVGERQASIMRRNEMEN